MSCNLFVFHWDKTTLNAKRALYPPALQRVQQAADNL